MRSPSNRKRSTQGMTKHEDLKRFIADNLRLVGGKWQWRTRILDKAESFAEKVFGKLPLCEKCEGSGTLRYGVISSSALSSKSIIKSPNGEGLSRITSNWSARHHLSCKACDGKGKVIP